MTKQDETERRLAESERKRAELERAVRMRDDLIAALSHELRAPLHAILGWSEILLGRTPPASADRPGLAAIARNARAQAQLIEDAADLGRVFSGKQRLEAASTDVAGAVAEAIESVHAVVQAKQLVVASSVNAQIGPCDTDPQRLQQIVARLLREASKLAPVGGELVVAARRSDAQLELTVAATAGAAMHSTSASLSIVKALAELQGGSLKIEGARFAVRLPSRGTELARPAALEPRRGPPSPRPAVVLDGVKVLVIDDDSDARDMVQEILLDARANAFTAASADEGLALLRDFKPDVIISDIGMSARDGYQFIRLVRMMPATEGGRTPAVALTAHVQTEDRTRALLAGYQEHLSKPVEAHQLLSVVHRLLEAAGARPDDPARPS